MVEPEQPVPRIKVAIPLRVRGMSTRHKFFDEPTETCYVGESSIITRIQNFVDLETELHVINVNNNLGGTYRVIWSNIQGKEGWHDLGLELIAAEPNLWGIALPSGEEAADGSMTHAWLQCQRCRESYLVPVPEAEDEFIYDGFLISRPCDRCKATTPWGFTPVESGEAKAADEAPRDIGDEQHKELRGKGRAPLNMKIKVIREVYGTVLEEVCETVNVSRYGACFLSRKAFTVGESIKVILPYKEGDVAIALAARVVRMDQAKDGFNHAVAIKLEGEMK